MVIPLLAIKNMGLKDGDRIKFGEGADSVELDWVE